MSEFREVSVLGADRQPGALTIGGDSPCELILDVGGRTYRSHGLDWFDSLQQLRAALERDGLLICVEGARGDVFPSGMSRQMGDGRRAYRHVLGRRPERTDLVDVFGTTCCDDVVSIAEQHESIRRLRASS
jgi:hypothetical protein